MTGFGKAICNLSNKKIIFELRSLNSKQADANLKLPNGYKEKELELRNYLLEKLQRGKMELSLREELKEGGQSVIINEGLVKNYARQLIKISGELNLTFENEHILNSVLRLPDVLNSPEEEINEKEWEIIFNCFKKAVEELIAFREQEGLALEKDIILRINKIQELLKKIPDFEDERIETVKKRINDNLKDLNQNGNIDENRFEQEIIYYLEKLDITEEKVRLGNHCTYFLETINKPTDTTGKKLSFISQEIGREINTIGSKANHHEIQKLVVQMKDELEKIKEQLMNVV